MSEEIFNEYELEVICLKSAVDCLDSMLNSEIIELRGNDLDLEVYFHQKIHHKYFYILLIDFLSNSSNLITGKSHTCFEFIKEIGENPTFNFANSVSELNTAVKTFYNWLNEEVVVSVWLPTIDTEGDIKLRRQEFIYICSNISKHNFMRLTNVSKKIKEILRKNEIEISLHDSLLMLNDFYERFHEDILIYHGSNITEMLNNIRWGIQKYLMPEFNRAYKKDSLDRFRYSYEYPEKIKDGFARSCYFDLMNSVRRKPNFKKFKCTKWLKLRY